MSSGLLPVHYFRPSPYNTSRVGRATTVNERTTRNTHRRSETLCIQAFCFDNGAKCLWGLREICKVPVKGGLADVTFSSYWLRFTDSASPSCRSQHTSRVNSATFLYMAVSDPLPERKPCIPAYTLPNNRLHNGSASSGRSDRLHFTAIFFDIFLH